MSQKQLKPKDGLNLYQIGTINNHLNCSNNCTLRNHQYLNGTQLQLKKEIRGDSKYFKVQLTSGTQ